MFFMLVLISVFCLFLNDAGFVFLKQRRATYRAVYLWGDRCDLPPAGVLATIDGERLLTRFREDLIEECGDELSKVLEHFRLVSFESSSR